MYKINKKTEISLLLALLVYSTLPCSSQSFASLDEGKAARAEVLNHIQWIQQSHGQFSSAVSAPSRRKRFEVSTASSDIEGQAGIFRPSAFGADPTGSTDSSAAFERCMVALLNASSSARHPMAAEIVDLGGATFDLEGGNYALSRPLIVPVMVGNLRIVGGTLRALPSFPAAGYLIAIGGAGECHTADNQKACNEFVDISDVLLDGRLVAAGGINVSMAMGTTIGPHVLVVGFVRHGIRVTGGHETMISEGWFGQCYWSDHQDAGCNRAKSESIAIWLDGADNIISNVIIFIPTNIGVLVTGPANLLTGVHTWNVGTAVYHSGITIGFGTNLTHATAGPEISGNNRVTGVQIALHKKLFG